MLLAALLVPVRVGAQRTLAAEWAVASGSEFLEMRCDSCSPPHSAITVERISGTKGPWWAPLASAAVPGSGQLLQGKRRAVPYFAMEAFLLVQYLRVRDDARDFRREYQRLAQVGRSFFTSTFPVGDFEYYERMEAFAESGAFDLGTGELLEPEIDTTTFNGFTWRLARETFWDDPDVAPPRDSEEYQRAVQFYRERAVTDQFRWSWQNAQLEQDLFRQTIQRSNSAFRASSQLLGVLIANHVLSAIDAFVVLRLSREPGDGAGEASSGRSGYRLEGRIPWAPLGRAGLMPARE